MARIITVTSGKGGVGKTNISVNLSVYLASQGYRTCLFDADLGLANVNILLGLYPADNLEDVIFGRKGMADVLIEHSSGLGIIPGSSGVEKMVGLTEPQRDRLVQSFSALDTYDCFVFDTAAGISRNVVSFCMASPEVLLVITPEPTSLTDAYALLKILLLNGFEGSVRVIVNQSQGMAHARNVFTKFKAAVSKFLPINILPGGTVVQDNHVTDALRQQKPFVALYPHSDAAKCIKNIGRYLLKYDPKNAAHETVGAFWTHYIETLKAPLQLRRDATAQHPQKSLPADGHPGAAMDNAGRESGREPQASLPEPTGTEAVQQDIHRLLGQLVGHMSCMSQDLSAIRAAIAGGATIPTG